MEAGHTKISVSDYPYYTINAAAIQSLRKFLHSGGVSQAIPAVMLFPLKKSAAALDKTHARAYNAAILRNEGGHAGAQPPPEKPRHWLEARPGERRCRTPARPEALCARYHAVKLSGPSNKKRGNQGGTAGMIFTPVPIKRMGRVFLYKKTDNTHPARQHTICNH